MIYLTLVTCLLAEPTKCRDVELAFEVPGGQEVCGGRGPMLEAAKWAADHPNWVVKRVECSRVKRQGA